jgi:hypothetical protein
MAFIVSARCSRFTNNVSLSGAGKLTRFLIGATDFFAKDYSGPCCVTGGSVRMVLQDAIFNERGRQACVFHSTTV